MCWKCRCEEEVRRAKNVARTAANCRFCGRTRPRGAAWDRYVAGGVVCPDCEWKHCKGQLKIVNK